MIDLNKIAKESLQIAEKRMQKTDTLSCLKHCSGEVLEAVECYTKYVYSPREEIDNLESELADVIMCILTLAEKENINIEQALTSCLEKNRKRINLTSSQDRANM